MHTGIVMLEFINISRDEDDKSYSQSQSLIQRKKAKLEKAMVPGYCQWFNIKFENDMAIYKYPLMNGYRSGDVEILVYIVRLETT
ncbi:hypothetical protein DPMN_077532 [Dreissena polymorpha]|uniref:Uncharacterized protein n=1 Tax=Dreissena polymorpha TaxID=45954 RepID=A0A9D3YQS6_DREPO|nr:hypothetical protein DPMN_077532 [Dreissena polymorpha]